MKILKFISKIDVRTVIKNISYITYGSLSVVIALFIFKGKRAVILKQLIAQQQQTVRVSCSQPFAMISINSFPFVQPVVERFQENASSIAEAGGELWRNTLTKLCIS